MIEEFVDKVSLLLQGKIPEKIDAEKLDNLDNEDERKLGQKLHQLIDSIREIHEFIMPLSQGKLNGIKMQPNNYLASPFKELYSRLVHLIWQATQVAKGDYNQRVDFMGDFSEAFNSMVIALERNETLLKKKIEELEGANHRITKLESILTICSNCKKIRLKDHALRDQNSWVHVESYISDRTKTRFSHSVCPDCMKKLYPDFVRDQVNEKNKSG